MQQPRATDQPMNVTTRATRKTACHLLLDGLERWAIDRIFGPPGDGALERARREGLGEAARTALRP